MLANLQNMFKFSENQHTHNTRTANYQQVSFPQVDTTNYGLHSVTYKAAKKTGTLFKIKSILTSLKIIHHRITS